MYFNFLVFINVTILAFGPKTNVLEGGSLILASCNMVLDMHENEVEKLSGNYSQFTPVGVYLALKN